MENTTTIKTTRLPRAVEAAKHRFMLQIPMPLWARMIKEGGITWGETTRFVLDAIEEKLSRMKPATK